MRQVRPAELPVELLRQKAAWNLDAYLELARSGAVDGTSFGLVFEALGECHVGGWHPFGCVVLVVNPIGRCVWADTVIVDKEHRNDDTVRLVFSAGLSIAKSLAKMAGLTRVAWATRLPERHAKLLEPEKVETMETVQAIELEG